MGNKERIEMLESPTGSNIIAPDSGCFHFSVSHTRNLPRHKNVTGMRNFDGCWMERRQDVCIQVAEETDGVRVCQVRDHP